MRITICSHGMKIGEWITIPSKKRWWQFWKKNTLAGDYSITAIHDKNSFEVEPKSKSKYVSIFDKVEKAKQ